MFLHVLVCKLHTCPWLCHVTPMLPASEKSTLTSGPGQTIEILSGLTSMEGTMLEQQLQRLGSCVWAKIGRILVGGLASAVLPLKVIWNSV